MILALRNVHSLSNEGVGLMTDVCVRRLHKEVFKFAPPNKEEKYAE